MELALGRSYLQVPMGVFGRATSPWGRILSSLMVALAGHGGSQKRAGKGGNNISWLQQGTVSDSKESRAKQPNLKAPALIGRWIWDLNVDNYNLGVEE